MIKDIVMSKNDDSIVIHLPHDKRIMLERIAERIGLNKSEYGRLLIDREIEAHKKEFEFMKSLFDTN
jgi:hypothetical protein